jgi:hypothetical protein
MKPHVFIRSTQALSRFVFIRVQILQTNIVKQKEICTLLLKYCLEILRFSRLLRQKVCSFPTFLAYVNRKQQSSEYRSHPRQKEKFWICLDCADMKTISFQHRHFAVDTK